MTNQFTVIIDDCKNKLNKLEDVDSQFSETTSSLIKERDQLQTKLLNAAVLQMANLELKLQAKLRQVEFKLNMQSDYQKYLLNEERNRLELAALKMYIKERYE